MRATDLDAQNFFFFFDDSTWASGMGSHLLLSRAFFLDYFVAVGSCCAFGIM